MKKKYLALIIGGLAIATAAIAYASQSNSAKAADDCSDCKACCAPSCCDK